MRIRLLLLALTASATFVLATARPCNPEPLDDRTAQTRASAVLVSSHVGDHRDAIGAGVVVGISRYGLRVVTAHHVVRWGDLNIWIDGRPFPAEVVRTFAHRDLAVVDALIPKDVLARMQAAHVASTAVTNDSIIIWGENDSGPRLERGRIVAPQYPSIDPAAPPLLGIACERCAPGDSGAGIFSADGGLLAILTARYRTADDRTIALVAELVSPSLFARADDTP